ncbi:Uncharacterised protein [Chlamydia trachomatis]|nr:Uncharacterised protein [Chlamydia trachomatis]
MSVYQMKIYEDVSCLLQISYSFLAKRKQSFIFFFGPYSTKSEL